jgi:hypothetical protein
MQNLTELPRTAQNVPELDKTFWKFCLVLFRTLKAFSWFCIVLAGVLAVLVELYICVLERSVEPIILSIVLSAAWLSPRVLHSLEQRSPAKPGQEEEVDTVLFQGVPYWDNGRFVSYLEI